MRCQDYYCDLLTVGLLSLSPSSNEKKKKRKPLRRLRTTHPPSSGWHTMQWTSAMADQILSLAGRGLRVAGCWCRCGVSRARRGAR